MAFVFKAEKPAFLSTKENFPGPGQYEIKGPEVEPNFVSFLTKEERKFGNSTTDVVKNPGPGSYNLPVSVQSYNKQTKAFQSTLNPQMDALEDKQQSTVFKSISKRKPFEQDIETPGPGAYFRHTGQKAVIECNTANFQKPVVREKQLEGGSVPSIPSFIHAYGYTEGGSKALRLNKNPLLEVQKFVGPGYYDPEHYGESAKPKGVAWEKTNPHKSDGFGLQIGTGNNVGPGSYKAKFKGYFPLYKLKPSAGFASKSGRSVFNAEKKNKPKKARNLMEEQAQDIEDLSEGAPGPGYYHNSSTASSFHQSQRPSTLQFFGSGNERFGDTFTTSGNMGPGKYNVTTDIARKIQKNQNMQIPFVTAVKRFVEKPEEGPAPGDYEVRTKIGGDSNANVAAKTQVESFGAVEPRFKAGNGDSVPGPGAYHKKDKEAMLKESVEMATAKNSHMFSSTSKREAIKAAGINVPPPGSYDVTNFNLATKVSKPDYEDPDLSPKKPPFGIAADRFRNTAVRIDEEDNDDGSFEEDWNTEGHNRGDLILKLRNQPKQNAAFVSQTKRVGVPMNKEKNHIPGPGKYHGTNHEDWIKKTYNVNFTTD